MCLNKLLMMYLPVLEVIYGYRVIISMTYKEIILWVYDLFTLFGVWISLKVGSG